MMYKNLYYLQRHYSNFKTDNQIISSYFEYSLRKLYPKIFLSHLKNEEDPEWYFQKENNQTADLQNGKLTTVIIGKHGQCSAGYVYAISLLPMCFWLVKQNYSKPIYLQDSMFSKYIKELKSSDNLLENIISGSMFCELFETIRPTGYIVDSLNFSKPLIVSGVLKFSDNQVFVVPNHKGYPDILISGMKNVPNTKRAVCQIIEWDYLQSPVGRLLPTIPIGYDILSSFTNTEKTEFVPFNLQRAVNQVLTKYNIQDKPFSDDCLKCIADNADIAEIELEERKKRIDFRDKCIVSIDPDDAKDLDDAIHVEKLASGNYELGVHIADVGHYVQANTSLDNEALSRSSTVYLNYKVIPMLPAILSEKLCSLNPDSDKLSFSVIMILDPQGEVISEKFMKSVIRTKMRLSYDQANKLIDNVDVEELQGNPDYEYISKSLKLLNNLAMLLRKRRMDSGAVNINKREVKFSMKQFSKESRNDNDNNNNNGTINTNNKYILEPIGFKVKVGSKSDKLVEEMMLLANQASAKLLYNNLKDNESISEDIGAFLRNHSAPDMRKQRLLVRLKRQSGLDKIDNPLKISESDKLLYLGYLIYLSMQMAEYCCAESNKYEEKKSIEITDSKFPFHHFGLNVPLYTHFTSPIRRYADLIVHRQIEAIINSRNSCLIPLKQRLVAAVNSNNVRINLKRVQDSMSTIFMAAYVNKSGWRLTKAVILGLIDSQCILLLPNCGILIKPSIKEIVPWMLKFNVCDENPMKIIFKYSQDDSVYNKNTQFGFLQRVFTLEKLNDLEKDMDKDYRIDNETNMFTEAINTMNELGKKLENIKAERFTVTICKEIDCIIYAKNDNLSVELPFPPDLSNLTNNNSVYL